jgi:hypothetical protein
VAGKFEFVPFAKMHNFIAITSPHPDGYALDLIAGAAGYAKPLEFIDIGVRAWIDLNLVERARRRRSRSPSDDPPVASAKTSEEGQGDEQGQKCSAAALSAAHGAPTIGLTR